MTFVKPWSRAKKIAVQQSRLHRLKRKGLLPTKEEAMAMAQAASATPPFVNTGRVNVFCTDCKKWDFNDIRQKEYDENGFVKRPRHECPRCGSLRVFLAGTGHLEDWAEERQDGRIARSLHGGKREWK